MKIPTAFDITVYTIEPARVGEPIEERTWVTWTLDLDMFEKKAFLGSIEANYWMTFPKGKSLNWTIRKAINRLKKLYRRVRLTIRDIEIKPA